MSCFTLTLKFVSYILARIVEKKKKMEKVKEKRDSIYRNKLNKTCFQLDITPGDFKDLPRKTTSGKVLR